MVVGLLSNSSFGFSVSVWVSVMCLIMLLESLVGISLLCVGFSLIMVSLR